MSSSRKPKAKPVDSITETKSELQLSLMLATRQKKTAHAVPYENEGSSRIFVPQVRRQVDAAAKHRLAPIISPT
jgi:hypothetical protein